MKVDWGACADPAGPFADAIAELRLPPDLPIRDSAELITRLQGLWPEYGAYVISFFVWQHSGAATSICATLNRRRADSWAGR